MSKKVNQNLLKINKEAAIERVAESLQQIEKGISEQDVQFLYYGLFEDSISIAGYLSFFGENQEKIFEYLKIAAQSSIILFKYQGKATVSHINLSDFEEDKIVDYSMTNPYVYIRAIYVAAIVEEIDILKYLLSIQIKILLKGQEPIPSDLMNFLKYIPSIIQKPSIFISYSKKTFWSLQTKVLKIIIEESEEAFEEAINDLSLFLSQYYNNEKYLHDPERFYLMPLHGLLNIKKYLKN